MNRTHTLAYNKELINIKVANALIGVVFFILATALGAYVRIPIKGSPVPITLQTFFVILSGAVLGKRLGLYSQLGYVFLGAAGLHIFQGYLFGVSHLLGPTGGYLVGFVFAAYIVGRLMEFRSFNIGHIIASFIVGDLIIHVLGTLWLIYLYQMEVVNAISIGILPFIPGEIVKVSLATIIYTRISQRSKTIFSI